MPLSCSYVFILNSEHNSNHIRVTIADFKQEKVYLDSFFWLWNYIHLHNFFSNNKALLSSTRTSYINVWNNKHWDVSERSNFLLFRVCYMRNNLACLGGYPTHLDVADVSKFFYFHFVFTWSRLMTHLPISNSVNLARRLCECLCTNLN